MIPSSDPLLNELYEVVARTFKVGREKLRPGSGPDTLEAWDSIGHLQLIMAVESHFHVRFSTEQIPQARNIAQLRDLLSGMGIHG